MAVASITETMQYLTFKLAEEVFALDITKVREVLEFSSVTKIPRTPVFMRGVINLRGSVVPVIDMRLKFGMTQTQKSVNTCVIIVEITLGAEKTVLGALVDSVQEVIELEPEKIESPPNIGMHMSTDFIKGMGKRDDVFIIILDIDRIFTLEELSGFHSAGNAASDQEHSVASNN
ncbi:MAG: chemotaxis protein CheW [Candidatus Magnetobacterium sp. LHC-1]|uniref:Chemotaxis protein CheW n=1 Tax=Candidatus Magnetobacterium casense TaxID=1455061 RepID=A0ABS6S0R0_9BACT|nr:chemotaxis protein CheW [Candidatus Magnetobacterium casensis]MBF0606764.1 chemotaxis protein CheW [Nitrospirota bacterium]MBV6342434.1 chemotaxis protein CheW [Candidatus Magnetobacterium casensis]